VNIVGLHDAIDAVIIEGTKNMFICGTIWAMSRECLAAEVRAR